jgi:hypothetical protein
MLRQLDTPARTKSLKFSYGITASLATVRHAMHIKVTSIRPGVFVVGTCTCDLWRYSCSCKTARTHEAKGISQQAKPCPHYLALYLSFNWTPTDHDPVLYLKTAGIEQPEILTTYIRVKEKYTFYGNALEPGVFYKAIPPQWVAIDETQSQYPGYILVRTPAYNFFYVRNFTRLTPFYE